MMPTQVCEYYILNVFLGIFTITVPKMVQGEYFEDLDMITELLRPQKPPTCEKVVEELEDDGNREDGDTYFLS